MPVGNGCALVLDTIIEENGAHPAVAVSDERLIEVKDEEAERCGVGARHRRHRRCRRRRNGTATMEFCLIVLHQLS